MAHTVIPPPRDTTATLELTHKGNINDKTIPERDREVRDLKHDQDRQQICVLSQAFRSLFQVAVIFLLSVFATALRVMSGLAITKDGARQPIVHAAAEALASVFKHANKKVQASTEELWRCESALIQAGKRCVPD